MSGILAWSWFNKQPYLTKIEIAQVPLEVGVAINSDFGDVLIVPGAGCNPGLGTVERLNLAASLYQIKRRKVIVSEGTCFPQEREEFHQRMVDEWGFLDADILWDTISMSTPDNISNSQIIAHQLGLQNAIICTSPYHQLRCWMVSLKIWEGEYRIATMPTNMLELEKHQVYVNKRGREIRQEYLKTLHHLFFLW